MANLTYQRVSLTGLAPSFAAASGGGDQLPTNGKGYLHYKNGSGAPITVTLVTPGNNKYGFPEPDVTVSVPAAGERLIGPIQDSFTDPTDQVAKVTYSGVTSLTVAAVTV